jgi:hypothetical protein
MQLQPPGASAASPQDSEAAIRLTVTRLARPNRAGDDVIERAAILAEGKTSAAILAWIMAHDGQPEALAPAAAPRGLHGARLSAAAGGSAAPRRYVLPAGVLR